VGETQMIIANLHETLIVKIKICVKSAFLLMKLKPAQLSVGQIRVISLFYLANADRKNILEIMGSWD
jgi:hypothetical protein